MTRVIIQADLNALLISIGQPVSYLLVKIARELNLAFEDLLVDGHGVVVVEGVNTCKHLVGEDAERPPVNGFAVAFVEEYFGG